VTGHYSYNNMKRDLLSKMQGNESLVQNSAATISETDT
jgi:hypothetical protein